jgi:catechol 2,3-dioxygenase-like lactoylglutathione lyase family enzyme
MKLENVHPVLAVNNIDDTIRFYRDVLGFECASRMDGWAALCKDKR